MRTDGWSGYGELKSLGYQHIVERRDACVGDHPLYNLPILLYLFLNAGSWALIRGRSVMNIWGTISMNSFSASIGGLQLAVDCSFSGFFRIQFSWSHFTIRTSSSMFEVRNRVTTRCSGLLSKVDTPFK